MTPAFNVGLHVAMAAQLVSGSGSEPMIRQAYGWLGLRKAFRKNMMQASISFTLRKIQVRANRCLEFETCSSGHLRRLAERIVQTLLGARSQQVRTLAHAAVFEFRPR